MIRDTDFKADNLSREILPDMPAGSGLLCLRTRMNEKTGKEFPWHWHSLFEIDFVNEGEIDFMSTSKTLHMKKGDAVFINSGVMHAFENTSGGETILTAILFDMSYLSGMNSLIESKYIYPIMRSSALDTLLISPDTLDGVKIMERVLSAVELMEKEPYGYEIKLKNIMNDFWLYLIDVTSELRSNSSEKISTDVLHTKEMIRFIQNNYGEKITLEDIAKSSNISDRECSRCFQRSINTSPINYLNDFRVRRAAQLLISSDMTIIEIGEECGFSSSSYFGKTFREKMGCTPSAYRNRKVCM